MLSKTKKVVILSGMLLLLVVTAYLNIVLNTDNTPVDDVDAQTMSFFDGYRMTRQEARNESLLILRGLAESTTDDAIRTQAELDMLALSDTIQLEMNVETELIAQGFEDAVMTTSPEGIRVMIACAAENFTKEEMAQILEIIVNQTGMSPINIGVIPV